MNNLPKEILQQILILLPQEDQFQCILTCHLWKIVIEDSCLFRTLNVYSYSLVDVISKKIQERPRLGNNVYQLALQFHDTEGDNLPSFLETLPNLRTISTYGRSYNYEPFNTSSKFLWYKHIEKIIEKSTKSIVSHLLSNNVCPNLTVLRVFDTNYETIPFLKNAPALKDLTLEKYHLDFNGINEIHDNLPNLEKFTLWLTTIHREGIEKTVKPANSITELTLSSVHTSGADLELKLLQFIANKYPNIVELEHGTYYSLENSEDEDTLFRDGWDPLLQNIGSQLKKLRTYNASRSKRFLPILDKHNCQIQQLEIRDFLPDFIQSQQVLHIRTLVLSNVRFSSLKWIKELEVLEALEIEIAAFQLPLYIDFNDLTNNCSSTLKSLKFDNLVLTADLLSARQYNIMDLSFSSCKLSEKVFRFIDRHFPLLANLELKYCRNLPKSINLRSAELESFCFMDTRFEDFNYILVRTMYDGEERRYFIKEKEYHYPLVCQYRQFNASGFLPIQSQPADTLKVKPDITLCCFTVKKLLCR